MSLSEGPGDRNKDSFTPALAVRIGIVGSVVLALFAIVFFRLWFLQVLTGSHYVEAAAHNTTRDVPVAAPRGKILASGGKVLVASSTALSVQIDPTGLPVKVNSSNILTSYSRDDAVYDRLAHVIGKGTRRHRCTVATPPPSCNTTIRRCPPSTTRRLSPIACEVAQQIALNHYADVTVKSPVSTRVEFYIDERASQYRGVEVNQTAVSRYPYGDLAAQTLGNVGRLTAAEQHQSRFAHINANSVVGQSGLEYEYDQYLRGTYGEQHVQVDAAGVPVGQGRTKRPIAGHNLQTTLDLPLEQVGSEALQHSIDANSGQGGAFIAMNPQTGAIYGAGSLPSYNPDVFTRPVLSTQEARRLFSNASNDPLFNRATQSAAPTGSTFKVITATAAMQSGVWAPDETFDDSTDLCFGNGTYCPQNSGGAHYGVINLADAIKVSDDEFFYNLGAKLNNPRPQGGALQTWARRYGIGQNPHVDLPGASSGLLPTPAWVDQTDHQEAECETATGSYRYINAQGHHSSKRRPGFHRNSPTPVSAAHPYGCGLGTADGTWTIGQNVLTAVGQGSDEVSPLQLAMVYAAIANGGTIVRPHVGDAIVNNEGTVLQKLSFPAQRHLNINPEYLDTIRTGLNEAAQGGGPDASPGTSQTVMQNFGEPVYAKTGTAQYIPTSGPAKGQETDSSWYAAYVPRSATTKPIVVVVWVEAGGFGAIGAAPVARQIMSQWFYGKPGPWTPGISKDQ